MEGKRRVLFAVLNWGLGHATRCVPLIQQCMLDGMDVSIASDGHALRYLQGLFPQAQFLDLPSYNIDYAKGRMLVPRLLQHFTENSGLLQQEQKVIAEYVQQNEVSLIISDSRLGCYHPGLKSVLLTHQLNPFTRWQHFFGGRWYQRRLKNFQEIWVPDDEALSLSGRLGINRFGDKVKYIGHLSQYQKLEGVADNLVLGIASGPPSHSKRMTQMLYEAFSAGLDDWIIVHTEPTEIDDSRLIQLPTWVEMNTLMNRAGCVVSNCGYSTLMDLKVLEKPAILFPTPGQQEQRFLAKQHGNDTRWRVIEDNTFTQQKAQLYEALRVL